MAGHLRLRHMRGSAVYVGEQRTLTPAKDRVTRHLHYAVSSRENRYGHGLGLWPDRRKLFAQPPLVRRPLA